MPLYHLNPKTGEPGRCRAMVSCPFGDLDSGHFPSAAAARAAYEEQQAAVVRRNLATVSGLGGYTYRLDVDKFLDQKESDGDRAGHRDRRVVAYYVRQLDQNWGAPKSTVLSRLEKWWAGEELSQRDFDVLYNTLGDLAFDSNIKVLRPDRHAAILLRELQKEKRPEWS